MAAVPEITQRGSFNAISAATQQLAGGVASLLAGQLVSFGAHGRLENFPTVGYVVVGSTVVAVVMAWFVQRDVVVRAPARLVPAT